MKLTKFPQSCILLEDAKVKILIDPGVIGVTEEILAKWKNPDYIFVTHKHSDHFDEESVKKIVSNKTKIYSTKEVAEFYPNTTFQIVKVGDKVKAGEIAVEIVKAIHGYTPLLKGPKEVKDATGLILNLEKKRIYHTGDTICFKNEIKCDVILLPFNNHGVCMSPFESALFANETGATLTIPIHYDNAKLPGDIEKMKAELERKGINYKFLKSEESIEL